MSTPLGQIKTPNLRKLRERGIQLDNYHVQQVCCESGGLSRRRAAGQWHCATNARMCRCGDCNPGFAASPQRLPERRCTRDGTPFAMACSTT